MQENKRGFSLIEVLVVVAIIMLLCAIIMPVFRSVREKAKIAVCASNLRQIGFSIRMYANDNHDYFPMPERRGNYWIGRWGHWAMDMKPYIDQLGDKQGYRTNNILQCPSYRDTYRNSWSYNHYAYNGHLDVWDNVIGGTLPVFFPPHVRADVVVVADGYADFTMYSKDRIYYRHDTQRSNNYEARGRTDGICNCLFGDLRVESSREVTKDMRIWPN